MSSTGPENVDGWDDFLEDENDVWFDALETGENGDIDVDHYDEFDNIQELVNFVAGTGSYSDRRSFVPGEKDKKERLFEMARFEPPKCPLCVEEIQERTGTDVAPQDLDIDPRMEVNFWVEEEEAEYSQDHEVRYVGHGVMYCDREGHSGATFLDYEEEWFE